MMNKEEIKNLITDLFSGSLSPTEKLDLEQKIERKITPLKERNLAIGEKYLDDPSLFKYVAPLLFFLPSTDNPQQIMDRASYIAESLNNGINLDYGWAKDWNGKPSTEEGRPGWQNRHNDAFGNLAKGIIEAGFPANYTNRLLRELLKDNPQNVEKIHQFRQKVVDRLPERLTSKDEQDIADRIKESISASKEAEKKHVTIPEQPVTQTTEIPPRKTAPRIPENVLSPNLQPILQKAKEQLTGSTKSSPPAQSSQSVPLSREQNIYKLVGEIASNYRRIKKEFPDNWHPKWAEFTQSFLNPTASQDHFTAWSTFATLKSNEESELADRYDRGEIGNAPVQNQSTPGSQFTTPRNPATSNPIERQPVREALQQTSVGAAPAARQAGVTQLEREMADTEAHQTRRAVERVKDEGRAHRQGETYADIQERAKLANEAANQIRESKTLTPEALAQIPVGSTLHAQLTNPLIPGTAAAEDPHLAEELRKAEIQSSASLPTAYRNFQDEYLSGEPTGQRPENVDAQAFLKHSAAEALQKYINNPWPILADEKAIPKPTEEEAGMHDRINNYLDSLHDLTDPQKLAEYAKRSQEYENLSAAKLADLTSSDRAFNRANPYLKRGVAEDSPEDITRSVDTHYGDYIKSIHDEALEQFKREAENRQKDFNLNLERSFMGPNWFGGARREAEERFKNEELNRYHQFDLNLYRKINDLKSRLRQEEAQRMERIHDRALQGAGLAAKLTNEESAAQMAAANNLNTMNQGQRNEKLAGMGVRLAQAEAKTNREKIIKMLMKQDFENSNRERIDTLLKTLNSGSPPMMEAPSMGSIPVQQPMSSGYGIAQGVNAANNAANQLPAQPNSFSQTIGNAVNNSTQSLIGQQNAFNQNLQNFNLLRGGRR